MTSGPDPLGSAIRAAYDSAGTTWETGPNLLYDRMAEVLVAAVSQPLDDTLVLDAGAGAGAVSSALVRRGARVVAVDFSEGMLAHAAAERPPAAVADIRALPFRTGSVGAALAAFVLNHLTDPAAGLRELGRVTVPGGPVISSTYAGGHPHPAQEAVEAVAERFGYERPPWYATFKREVEPATGSAALLLAAARSAGLLEAEVRLVDVDLGQLTPRELVAWRLGMASCAPFLASLSAARRTELWASAKQAVGDDMPPVVQPVLILRAAAPW